ncbi:hypothetical protein SLNWT_1588 [Streptomyces albus]|uniref:Uncharacterized protein n=1 Tax=Streptomyces albus (strain ATCC 21838 / DSM 41398 / FERM P-419 / JCM 4703 / NBRC 107858) TaxID=1081613 RepID=A0A0B5EK91_STRA4|nr:hypothetical protein SLNWT_1588 [Streptomyces albus]AYN32068.1 hypothetical protein DUI70_1565 [Streptomyces albus]
MHGLCPLTSRSPESGGQSSARGKGVHRLRGRGARRQPPSGHVHGGQSPPRKTPHWSMPRVRARP